jgi:hypothetical protein
MSDKINDGGQAFPFEYDANNASSIVPHPGMSLRDWFAGMALQGMLACPQNYKFEDSGLDSGIDGLSKCAYKQADAMIAERSK